MKSLSKFSPYLRPYWVAAVLAPLLMALEVAMDLAQPRLLQDVVDKGVAHGNQALVIHLGGLMLLAGLGGLIGGAGCTLFSTIAGLGFGTDVRSAVFRKVQRLSFGNLDHLETGRLITRLTSDVDQVQEAVVMILRILVRAPLLVIGSLIMAALTDPLLTLLLVAISPLILLTLTRASRRGHALFLAVQDRLDRLNIVLQENLAGVRVVKAFVRRAHEVERFGLRNDALKDANVSAALLLATVMPIMMLLVNAGVVGVMWFGGWQVTLGRLQVGQLLAFTNYLLKMLESLMMVGMLVMRLAQADASAERITGVLETEPEIQWSGEGEQAAEGRRDTAGRPTVPPRRGGGAEVGDGCVAALQTGGGRQDTAGRPTVPPGRGGGAEVGDVCVAALQGERRGEVVFEEVSFSYDGAEAEPVLRGVSFSVAPGETLAILGATGSGKSTLVYLVPRFYEVSAGRVLVGGRDVRERGEEELRRDIGMVMQDTILFSGTIRDNIRYGDPEADDASVETAARLAQAHDFITAMPEGYDTELGQRGVNLSGGQKQRLALARALLPDPPILILDDCTSAVDAATEARLLAALSESRGSCTRLIVAQRIASALCADRILLLEEGAVSAVGTHTELLQTSALYREIVASQLDTEEAGDE